MNEEILKLAKECDCYRDDCGFIECSFETLEAFYKAAYNAGIEAAAKMCKSQEDSEYATGKVDHNERSWCSSNATAILALEMK